MKVLNFPKPPTEETLIPQDRLDLINKSLAKISALMEELKNDPGEEENENPLRPPRGYRRHRR